VRKSGYEFSQARDPSSNAEAMALKRAAAKFGLGLYHYQKWKGKIEVPNYP